MPIVAEFTADGRLRVVSMRGVVTAEEFIDYRAQLGRTRTPRHRVSFIDLSHVDRFEFGFGELLVHAETVQSNLSDRPEAFTEVIWAPSDASFEMARMYQALAVGEHIVHLHRDRDLARRLVRELLEEPAWEIPQQ
ncbi:MAG: hypothetical protein KDC38_03660 [Planctomycetes bacterium]|nr:hypothetical protein [Planctomycetota bacterium]